MLGDEGELLHPAKHTLSRTKQASATLIVGSVITSRLHKSNAKRQPVRAEYWPKLEKLASRTRLHAFVRRRPVQIAL